MWGKIGGDVRQPLAHVSIVEVEKLLGGRKWFRDNTSVDAVSCHVERSLRANSSIGSNLIGLWRVCLRRSCELLHQTLVGRAC